MGMYLCVCVCVCFLHIEHEYHLFTVIPRREIHTSVQKKKKEAGMVTLLLNSEDTFHAVFSNTSGS